MDIQESIKTLEGNHFFDLKYKEAVEDAILALKKLKKCREVYDAAKRKIIDDVIDERERQDEKWGEQNHFTERWATIIGEEYGEMCEAINEFRFNPTLETEEDIYTETIQTMASCMAMLECMERSRSINGKTLN